MSSLSVILQADTSGFSKAVQDAKNLLEQYTQKNQELQKQIKESTGVTDAQVNAYKRVIKQLEKVGSGSLSTAQQQKVLENQIKELKIQWANLSETAKNSDFGKSISEQTQTAEKHLSQLREQMKAVSGDMDNSSGKVETLSSKLGGNLVTSIMSLVGKFAVLATAQQAFDRLVNSNQNSADSFAEYTYAAKNAVDRFFYAISTGDFSVFHNGLDNLISRARDAAAAIDQLGNTIMSYNVINAKAQSKIKAARAILYDPKSTEEQKEKAKKDLQDAYKEIKDAAEFVVNDTANEIKKEVEAKSNISLGTEGALDLIDYWLEMDAKEGRNKYKEKAEKKYKEYQKADSELRKKYTVKQPTSTTSYGAVIYTDVIVNVEEYRKEQEKLNETFKDAIVYKTLLKDATDEELNKIGQNRIAMIQYGDAASDAAVQTGRLTKQFENQSNTTKNIPDVVKIPKLKLDIEPIKWGKTEKDIKEHIAELNKKIENTPEGVLRLQLIVERDEAEKQLKDFGKNPIQIEIEAKANNLDLSGVKNADLTIGIGDKSEVLKKNAEGINEMLSSSERLYSVWNRIGDSFDNGNIIEQFFAISNAISSTIDSVQNLINGFQQVGEAVQQLQEIYSAASQQKLQEDSAETASNLTKASSASSAAVSEGVHKAVSTSHSWQEVIIAIAAVISAISAALAMAGKFAQGGIVKGPTSIGDYNLIRVNSGEMVLNKTQQAKLFRILNGQLNPVSNNNLSGDVRFKVEGSALVGVLNNYNKKRSNI